MKTYRSQIYVQDKQGNTPKGIRVSLSFDGFLGGISKPFYTDSNGVAIIEHASKGKATVYVRGNTKGTFNAPGEKVVFI